MSKTMTKEPTEKLSKERLVNKLAAHWQCNARIHKNPEECSQAFAQIKEMIEQSPPDAEVDEALLQRASISLIKWFHKNREMYDRNELVVSLHEIIEKILLQSAKPKVIKDCFFSSDADGLYAKMKLASPKSRVSRERVHSLAETIMSRHYTKAAHQDLYDFIEKELGVEIEDEC